MIFFLPFFICVQVRAQVSTNSGHGEASNDEATMTYSVGQLFYKSVSTGDFDLFEGVQLPFLISGTGVLDITLTAEVYPNPVKDCFTLSVNGQEEVRYVARLTDMGGKIIKLVSVVEPKTSFNIESLAPGFYSLFIVDKNKIVKTFKIVKL